MTRTFVCSSCGMYDFDARFDLRFRNQLCCEFVLVNETPIARRQTLIVDPPEVFWTPEQCARAMKWFRRDT